MKKPNLYLLLLLLILILGVMILLRTLGGQTNHPQSNSDLLPRDYTEIAREGVLRVVAPYHAFDRKQVEHEDGAISLSLTRRLSRLCGLEVQVILDNSEPRALDLLRQGQADLVLLPSLQTDQLDTAAFALVADKLSNPICLVQRKDSLAISRQIDLAGKTIVLPKGSQLGLFVEHLSEEIGDQVGIVEDPQYTTEQLIIKVATHHIDYTLCSAQEAEGYRALFPDLDFSLPISYTLRQGWLVRKESPLLADSLTQWVRHLSKHQ